jgi:type II restriction/modification system DNA methylase subunit YeeA
MGNKGMNPNMKIFLEEKYQNVKSDLFSAFIVRSSKLTLLEGQMGFMTPFVWMFISSYEKLRKFLIKQNTITSLVQLEYSGFDGATVSICTFTIENFYKPNFKGTYIKLSDFRGVENQAPKTLEAVRNPQCGYLYSAKATDFAKIPGSTIAYWSSDILKESFKKGISFEDIATPRQGLGTTNNDKFLRLWFEIALSNIEFFSSTRKDAINSEKKWFPYNKGGDFRRWYGNNEYTVNWYKDGAGIKEYIKNKNPNVARSESYYFKEGITWGLITSSIFSCRYIPCGFIFDVGGSSAFPPKNLMSLSINFLNSSVSKQLLKCLNPTLNTQVGDLQKLPIITGNKTINDIVQPLSDSLIKLSKIDWDNFETSWDFQTHPLLRYNTPSLPQAFSQWQQQSETAFQQLKHLEQENNKYWIEAYGLQDELNPEVPDDQITIRRADLERDIKSLISYAVGCMMGRYSLDKPGLIHAGQPFDPNQHQQYPADNDGILPITDQAYFEDDILQNYLQSFKLLFIMIPLTQFLKRCLLINRLNLASKLNRTHSHLVSVVDAVGKVSVSLESHNLFWMALNIKILP